MKMKHETLRFKAVLTMAAVICVVLSALLSGGCTLSYTEYLELEPQYQEKLKKRYLLQEQVHGFHSWVTIIDQSGYPHIKTKKKPLSTANWYKLLDRDGKELLRISEKFFNFAGKYKIYRGEELQAVVKQHGIFNIWYSVEIPGKGSFKVTGHDDDYRFRFKRDREVFAVLAKRRYGWPYSYCMDMAPGENEALLLATAIIIHEADPTNQRERRERLDASFIKPDDDDDSDHDSDHERHMKIHNDAHNAHMKAHNAAVNGGGGH